MPQIFRRSANGFFRAALYGGVFFAAGGVAALMLLVRSDYNTRAGVPIEQPVPFSHRHHVGDDGIDCRYCHTTVETSAFAGMPPTQTCMNCHTQIWSRSEMLRPVRESWSSGRPIVWKRVHNLSEYAYFDHSIHVAKGIGCSTCHGPVDDMPLTWQKASLQMSWCVNCHQHPERHIRPREEVFNMQWQPPPNQVEMGRELVRRYNVQSLVSCSVCHR